MPPRRIIPVDMDMNAAVAFFRTIGIWAEAVENGDTKDAEIQVRKLEILGQKMAEDEAFKRGYQKLGAKLEAQEMLECLRDYLGILTQVGPSRDDKYQQSKRDE